jgi:hypothetical protein
MAQLAEEYKILNCTIVGSRNMFHKLAGEVLVKIKEGKEVNSQLEAERLGSTLLIPPAS